MTPRQKQAGKGRIKFQNPPINELVIGIYHLPILELKAQHIGIYWESIRDRFPNFEQQHLVVGQFPGEPHPLLPDVPGEIFPLPRFWFSSAPNSTLIQVQRNAFLLNWRRGPTDNYPHYERVERDFWQEFDKYRSFIRSIGGNIDVVQNCELNYINIIGPNDVFSSPSDLGNVLPHVSSLSKVQGGEYKLAGLNASATYQISSNLLVTSSTKLGKKADTGEIAAVFELKAFGAPSDLSIDKAADWFKTAHDSIYKLFLSMTDKNVQQQIWKPVL